MFICVFMNCCMDWGRFWVALLCHSLDTRHFGYVSLTQGSVKQQSYSTSGVDVGQLRQHPTVWGVQVPEGSRGIVEVHPIGTPGCNQTEAAHPYITTHPEMRDRKRGSEG